MSECSTWENRKQRFGKKPLTLICKVHSIKRHSVSKTGEIRKVSKITSKWFISRERRDWWFGVFSPIFDKSASGNCSQHFTLLFQLCYRHSCDIHEISQECISLVNYKNVCRTSYFWQYGATEKWNFFFLVWRKDRGEFEMQRKYWKLFIFWRWIWFFFCFS